VQAVRFIILALMVYLLVPESCRTYTSATKVDVHTHYFKPTSHFTPNLHNILHHSNQEGQTHNPSHVSISFKKFLRVFTLNSQQHKLLHKSMPLIPTYPPFYLAWSSHKKYYIHTLNET